MQKININIITPIRSRKHSCEITQASSLCPTWACQGRHPLGSPVSPHLLLHPHRHRPPGSRLPRCRLLAPSSPGQVGYSRLCTNLNEMMQVFAALSPLADHLALEFPEGLEPCHQPADLPWLSTIVQTVQPLKRATILSRQFSCSTVNFCLNQCGGIL